MTPQHQIHENLNYLHCVIQELENDGVELPMGNYYMLYEMIENARDYFEQN